MTNSNAGVLGAFCWLHVMPAILSVSYMSRLHHVLSFQHMTLFECLSVRLTV